MQKALAVKIKKEEEEDDDDGGGGGGAVIAKIKAPEVIQNLKLPRNENTTN